MTEPAGHGGATRRERRERNEQERAYRRFYYLTTLSTLLPGAGLIPTRMRRLGLLITGLALVSAVTGLGYAAAHGVMRTLLALAVRPTVLTVAIVVVVLGLAIWLAGILLTAKVARPHDGRMRLTRNLFVAFLCLVVVTPSAVAARYLTIQKSLVDDVFDDRGATLAEGDAFSDIPRINVLLIGSDAGTGRTGVRTDSMMVASFDTRTGQVVLFGIPRNLERAPIPKSNPLSTLYPDGYSCGDACLINGIWTLAEDHKDLFPGDPNPGLRSTKDVVGATLGLEIQRTVVIDLSGFRQLVDAMGGVDINVRERVCVNCKSVGGRLRWTTDKHEYIEPGPQHLDGLHALWYARSRALSSDFDRMRRQRCVTGALIQQADVVSLLARYGDLAKVVKDNVVVDIPQDELQAWVDLVLKVQKQGKIRSLPFTDKVIKPGRPDYDLIHEMVANAISSHPTATATPSSHASSAHPTSSSTGPTSSATPAADDTLSDLTATC